MARPAHILFTSTFSTPFIREDLTTLRAHHRVTAVTGGGIVSLLTMLVNVPRVDLTFSWFLSVYSSLVILFASLFGKRTIVVLGGVDTANMPEYGYGLWTSAWRSTLASAAVRRASLVLAVDETLKSEIIQRASYDGKNITVLPTGYDAERWNPDGPKMPVVLTIAHTDTRARGAIKGLDLLPEIAAGLPDVQFRLIGISPAVAATYRFPGNITVIGPVTQEELLREYRSASVYLQTSRREGFPNVLCEAMLCGCTPVASDAGASRTIVGDTGVIVSITDIDAVRSAVTGALHNDTNLAARDRVKTMFPLSLRREGVLRAVEGGNR